MNERPIIFSGPMVNAILSGKKTQTRRVIKERVEIGSVGLDEKDPRNFYLLDWETKEYDPITLDEWLVHYCRYQPGVRMWVRETWTQDGVDTDYLKSVGLPPVHYRANGEAPEYLDVRWRPSIFMPREYSRIILEVVSTQVERIQQITEQDAIAEGCPWGEFGDHPEIHRGDAVDDFRYLWDSINSQRGYAWETNPWVVAIGFKRIS